VRALVAEGEPQRGELLGDLQLGQRWPDGDIGVAAVVEAPLREVRIISKRTGLPAASATVRIVARSRLASKRARSSSPMRAQASRTANDVRPRASQ